MCHDAAGNINVAIVNLLVRMPVYIAQPPREEPTGQLPTGGLIQRQCYAAHLSGKQSAIEAESFLDNLRIAANHAKDLPCRMAGIVGSCPLIDSEKPQMNSHNYKQL